MLNPVSEPLVNNVLPALRSIVAQKLNERGFSQSEVAEMMELTQPAVSQYVNSRRGGLVESLREDRELDNIASEIATAVSHGNRDDVREGYIEFCHKLVDQDRFRDMTGYKRDFFMEF